MSKTRLKDLEKQLAVKEAHLEELNRREKEEKESVFNKVAKLVNYPAASHLDEMERLESEIIQLRKQIDEASIIDKAENKISNILGFFGSIATENIGQSRSEAILEKNRNLADEMRQKYNLTRKK